MTNENIHKARLFDLGRLPMDFARLVCTPLPLILRLRRVTPEGKAYQQKLRGGTVVVANHTSFLDPFVVGVTFWYRRVFFLIAEIVMKGWLRSLLLRGIGGIKVERGIADIEAIKKSVAILKEGRVLTVFPQGGIVQENEVETIKSGAILMAMQAGVPILPIYICPRAHWYCRRTVVVGQSIDPKALCTKKIPSTADIAAITQRVMQEMNRCIPNHK